MKRLVLANQRPPLFTDIRVGWRITCGDGSPYDLMWGSCPPHKLDALLNSIREQNGEIEIVDVRGVQDGLRDRAYYERTT